MITQAIVTVEGMEPYTVPNIVIIDINDPDDVEETRTIVRNVVENIFELPATVRFEFEETEQRQ